MHAIMGNRGFRLECNAGDGDGVAIDITRDEELDICDEVFVWNQSPNFTSYQRTFRDRLRAAWALLRGKEYIYHEIIVDKEDIIALGKWINDKIK